MDKPLGPSVGADDDGNLSDTEVAILQGQVVPRILNERERPVRVKVLVPFLLTLMTVLATAGLGAALLIWLVTHHAVQGQTSLETLRQQRAFIVDEGTRNEGTESRLIGLTISSIASSLIGVTIPLVMTLYAYRIAYAWVAASQEACSSNKSLPTPLQFGLLLRLLGSSSFLSIFDASGYLLRRRRPAIPPMLTRAFSVCVLVVMLAHMTSLADIWVHSSTHALLAANFTTQIEPQAMAVLFNETICDDTVYPTPCLQAPDSWGGGELSVRNAGFLLAANSSASFKLVTLSEQEDTALVVPSVLNSTTRFNATSFASRSKCTSLNPRCQSTSRDGMRVVESCANAGYPQLPYWDTTNVVHPILSDGTVVEEDDSISVWPPSLLDNPFNMLVQLRWPTLSEDASINSSNIAVDSDDANSTMSLYATCVFTFLNVTYSYGDGAFGIIDETPTTPNTSNILWGPMINQLANPRLASDLQAAAQSETNADNVMALLGQDLSRLGLGMIGGVFMTSSMSVQQELITTKTLGYYDAVPIFVLIGLLWIYSLIAVYVFVVTVFTRAPALPRRAVTLLAADSDVSQLNLAHGRLTNPLPLVADLFHSNVASLTSQLSMAKSPMEMFEESSETSRLVVGLGEGKYPVYGLRRRFEYEDGAVNA